MIRVTVVCAPAARAVFEQELTLAEGVSAQDAVAASTLDAQWAGICWRQMTPGVWGRAVQWHQPLKDGDRLELCRPLTVDPKVARRERFQQQGARGTGLFARRREGGKQGY